MKIKTFDEIEIVISNKDLLALMCRARQADMLLRQNRILEKNIIGLRHDVRQKDEALIKRNDELEKFHAEGGAAINGSGNPVTNNHQPATNNQSERSPNAAAYLARSVDRMVLNLRRLHDMAHAALDAYCDNPRTGERYMLLSNAISQIREFVVFEATGEVVRQSLMFKLQEQFKEAKGGEA